MILPGAEPFFLPGGEHGVLMIHGFTGLPAELLIMGRFLNARGFTVLGIRLAGHGTTAEDLSRMTQEDWLDSARDGYAILSGAARTVSVVGHSMGGLYALRIAAEYPVMRAVTLAAPIYIAKEQGIEGLPPREASVGVFFPKARRKLANVPPAANMTYTQMPLVSVHELLSVINETKEHLAEIVAPTLVVHGDADKTADIRSANYIYDHLASADKELCIVKDEGHLLPMESHREYVFLKTAEFLEKEI